jgi:hypothetical protein
MSKNDEEMFVEFYIEVKNVYLHGGNSFKWEGIGSITYK